MTEANIDHALLAAELQVLKIAVRQLSTYLPDIAQKEDFIAQVRKKAEEAAAQQPKALKDATARALEEIGCTKR